MVKQATLASFFGGGNTKGRKPNTASKEEDETVDTSSHERYPRVSSTVTASLSKVIKRDDLSDSDDESKAKGSDRKEKEIDSKEAPSRRKRQKIMEDSDSSNEEMDDNQCLVKGENIQSSIAKDSVKYRNTNSIHATNDDDGTSQENTEAEDEDSEDDHLLEEESMSHKTTGMVHVLVTKQDISILANSHRNSNNNGSNSHKNNAASSAAALLSSTESILSDKSCLQNVPIPYSVLCRTLSEIEAISSRLEIQKHLTNLFRLCLLRNPQDLIHLVYLASNSVAAAYQCVELGIGDSILIKAIGEASGSNPSMIKQKYEADGDLGTVAMTAKGKQRTLGFGIKPKPLAAKEVLSVFRQIAMTTGAQSQKWKMSKIKGLLVRVEDPVESKYIIRGLQGKLRIGLAQSTVLISLAHAVLLSEQVKEPKESELGTRALSVDSKNVRNTKLALETRLESAVNIVKKAYSEVSSFDALVEALLKYPISILNEKCTLTPGIPVEPMLAKPTKSIQEVLKRLNGKRFTCEFKYDGERAQVHMDSNGVTKVCIESSFICLMIIFQE